jgi:hypothetical protein
VEMAPRASAGEPGKVRLAWRVQSSLPMVHPAHPAPLLRLVLLLGLMLLALAAGMSTSGAHTGWLFLGSAFAAAPVAAVVDGRARHRREAPRHTHRISAPRATRATRVAPV